MLAKKWNDYTALCVNVCKKLRVFRMESETACPWTQIVACKCVCVGGCVFACLWVCVCGCAGGCACVFVGRPMRRRVRVYLFT